MTCVNKANDSDRFTSWHRSISWESLFRVVAGLPPPRELSLTIVTRLLAGAAAGSPQLMTHWAPSLEGRRRRDNSPLCVGLAKVRQRKDPEVRETLPKNLHLE